MQNINTKVRCEMDLGSKGEDANNNVLVVVIDQADELTREAQAALRRTMEKYTTNLRLILCCNSLSKLIAPLRSRCLILRVPRPTLPEVKSTTSNKRFFPILSHPWHRSPQDYSL